MDTNLTITLIGQLVIAVGQVLATVGLISRSLEKMRRELCEKLDDSGIRLQTLPRPAVPPKDAAAIRFQTLPRPAMPPTDDDAVNAVLWPGTSQGGDQSCGDARIDVACTELGWRIDALAERLALTSEDGPFIKGQLSAKSEERAAGPRRWEVDSGQVG